MAYEMVMPYHLHMPSYFLETFTEYPVLFSLFLILSIICTAFAACIPKKIHRDFRLTVPRLYS